MVARSKSPTGPFETLEQAKGVPHSLMLFKSERWLAPGHNCIIQDRRGEDWIVYHAIDVNRPRQTQQDEINSRRVLLIDRIEWRDGWPHVGSPSDTPQPTPRRLIAPAARYPATLARFAGEQRSLRLKFFVKGPVDVAVPIGDYGGQEASLGVA